jgi:hypothetical protein
MGGRERKGGGKARWVGLNFSFNELFRQDKCIRLLSYVSVYPYYD